MLVWNVVQQILRLFEVAHIYTAPYFLIFGVDVLGVLSNSPGLQEFDAGHELAS